MTKQEEIREGLENMPIEIYTPEGLATTFLDARNTDKILNYLADNDVMIKVVGELPERCYFSEENKDMELELSGHTSGYD